MSTRRTGTGRHPPLTHFRAWPRRRLAMPTSIVDLDHGASFAGRSVDLGIGGARVDVVGPDPSMLVDTSVELVLSAPMRWDPLRVRGKVAWRGAAGVYGFRFEHASPAGLLSLWELLESALD